MSQFMYDVSNTYEGEVSKHMDNSSILTTYILVAICVALPFLVEFLTLFMVVASGKRNGRGIDAIGAALFTVMLVRVMQIAGLVAYLVLWIYSAVRVFKLGMPKLLILLPIIPIAADVILSKRRKALADKAREPITAEAYIAEVLSKKAQYEHVTYDSKLAIYVYGYIRAEVVSDLWPQKYKYNMDWQARKAIADVAIPALMKNLESDTLCYTKMWTPDGKRDGKYYHTTMEYWKYDPAKDILMVKFSHKDKPDVFENKWADKV